MPPSSLPPPPLDLPSMLAATTAALGVPFGLHLSSYAVIVLAAAAGAVWGSSGRPSSGRWDTAKVVIGRVGFALMLAVPFTMGLITTADKLGWEFLQGLDWRVLLAPVAAVLGGIGPRWFLSAARNLLARRFGVAQPPAQGGHGGTP